METRIVVDTNVFIGACLGAGAAASVVRLCLTGQLRPLMGAALLAEYEDVLSREELMQGSRLTRDERDVLFDIFAARCEWTRVYFAWRPNLPDEADNHLIELAVAGAATFVVSRNLRDLKRGELRFPGLRCLEPVALLKEMNL
jgi:putative PIN family toxin of toxin-antitoxin system